jgi:hypothetical protein
VIFEKPAKRYLGDGAYVDFDRHHIVLTTEDGVRETNRICLEDEVLLEFERYVQDLKAAIRQYNAGLERQQQELWR